MMNRKQLEQLKQLRKEIKSINRKLEQRKGRAQAQTDVVKGSLSEFPILKRTSPLKAIAIRFPRC